MKQFWMEVCAVGYEFETTIPIYQNYVFYLAIHLRHPVWGHVRIHIFNWSIIDEPTKSYSIKT